MPLNRHLMRGAEARPGFRPGRPLPVRSRRRKTHRRPTAASASTRIFASSRLPWRPVLRRSARPARRPCRSASRRTRANRSLFGLAFGSSRLTTVDPSTARQRMARQSRRRCRRASPRIPTSRSPPFSSRAPSCAALRSGHWQNWERMTSSPISVRDHRPPEAAHCRDRRRRRAGVARAHQRLSASRRAPFPSRRRAMESVPAFCSSDRQPACPSTPIW